MKVVLFCGGFGMRLREYSERIPKPLVNIGPRPIVWHLMKYYSYYGHKDFILCLGWKGKEIKDYFLNYDECTSNDFVLESGGNNIKLLNSDIDDWSITFVDTGPTSCIGERLVAVRPYVRDDETFLANYTDGLSDLHLPSLIDAYNHNGAVAALVTVPPHQSFHVVETDRAGSVQKLSSIVDCNVRMNGGFFVLGQEIFDYIRNGEDLVEEPFQRLIGENRLCALKHDGFWACMDTYKEKQDMDDMYECGKTPWQIWKKPIAPSGA